MSAQVEPFAQTDVGESGTVETAPKRRGTLLIVDDEDGPRQSLRVIFKDDYDLLMAEDGPTAIELAQKHDIDVAILDIRMAGMSGIEVLERLRFVKPDIEAIMMTAFETTDTIRQALRLRACDYINKPFDIATMRAAVHQAMQRRRLENEIHNSAEKVQELLTELQNQRIEEQIAKTRGDIYASIIHDINGPLTVISGFVQVLNQRLNRATRLEVEDLEFIRERLRIIARQVTNCIEISRRYLGFLRRQSGAAAPAVSVNQLLHDLDQLLRVHPSLLENEFGITPLAEDIAVKINGTDLIQILRRDQRRSPAHAPGFDAFQRRPARPLVEHRRLGQHPASGEILRAGQWPGYPGRAVAENLPAVLHHQRAAAGNRFGAEHCSAPSQGRGGRTPRAYRGRPGNHLHHLPARRPLDEMNR
jgi:DNA-binding response OmpR family regulator